MNQDNRMTVLVVDDEPVNLEVVGQMLAADYRVLVATTGEKALSLTGSTQVDLVLLDVVMPDLDGYAVCRQLKDSEATRDIPVIFVTAKNEQQFETTGFEVGGVDYVTKPVNPAILRVRVKTHLELKRKNDLLKSLTNQDGLTGLANRRYLDHFLDQEWRRAIRRGRSWLSGILLDVDYFKRYNDGYGHLAGDDCLRKVAEALKSCLERGTDLVARYGGEEFCCILPETPLMGAVSLAERIRNTVAELAIPHAYSEVADRVTISVGVASVIPMQNLSCPMLLAEADKQLYTAKQEGRNRTCFVDLTAG